MTSTSFSSRHQALVLATFGLAAYFCTVTNLPGRTDGQEKSFTPSCKIQLIFVVKFVGIKFSSKNT